LYWWRQVIEAPAWLVNVYFVRDPDAPTTHEQWEVALGETREALGLHTPPPHTASVFLEAGDRQELLSGTASDR
jgi:hypothetical protein